GEVMPEEAHRIGVETARRMWGDEYEIVVTTHLNTDHLQDEFCQGYFLPKMCYFS
ncbi:MAG: relaxase/mobilization nuclease domain-containing protein, partial [Ruminococcus sp.]|nr:relaxase/mobilization nuclease domain-containing protein [Ruminococcus sp.]